MKDLAPKDLNDLVEKEKYENELKIFLLPNDDDNKNAIVEIRAEWRFEASLFCADLLKCMKKFAPKKWKLEIINISKSEAGGYKEVIFSVNGMIYIHI